MNRYHSFYLADLETKIREVAMENMMWPSVDENVSEKFNSNAAIYNCGVREFSEFLIKALRKEAEEENGSVD